MASYHDRLGMLSEKHACVLFFLTAFGFSASHYSLRQLSFVDVVGTEQAKDSGTTSTTLRETEKVSLTCEARWEVFSSDRPFTATQVVHKDVSKETQESVREFIQNYEPQNIFNLFVHPPSNFAMCYIPKNGCSQWIEVLGKILYDEASSSERDYSVAYYSRKHFHIKQDDDAMRQIFQNPNSTRAVFIREPMARFVSAFLNKCFVGDCGHKLCFPRTYKNITKGQQIPFRHALEWILDERTDLRYQDRHYRPQSLLCGLDHPDALGAMYNIVGYVDKTTMSQDASCIMDKAGLTRYNTRGGGPETDPFWIPHAAFQLNNKPRYRSDNEEELLKRLFTTDLARQFIQKYRMDYDMFHIPEPAWVAEATGEWLDSVEYPEGYPSCEKKIV